MIDTPEPWPIPEGQTWYRSDERKFYRMKNGRREEFMPDKIRVEVIGGPHDGAVIEMDPASDTVTFPRHDGGQAVYRLDRSTLKLV